MISGVAPSSSFGFDRVFLSGRKGQGGDSASVYSQKRAADEDKIGANGVARTDSNASSASDKTGNNSSQELSVEQQRQIDKLVVIDRQVRAHEQAHVSVGGNLVQGAANYDYQTGPDGKRYAVGGEVSIDTSKGRTPEETIPKAQRIRAAALAPADPSPQDNQVAALASRMEMEAQQELALQRAQENNPSSSSSAASMSPPSAANRVERSLAAYADAARSFGDSMQSPRFRAYA